MRSIIYLILVAVFFISCDEESLDDLGTAEPIYSAEGIIDGQTFSYRGGVGSYFMFPRTTVNPYAEGLMLEGVLGPTCPQEFCTESIRLRYFDDKDASEGNDLEESTYPLLKLTGNNTADKYLATFTATPIDDPTVDATYEWTINEQFYQGLEVQDTFTGSEHLVCLSILDQDRMLAQKCRTISFNNQNTCDVQIIVQDSSGSQGGVAQAASSGEPPFTVHWNQPGADQSFIFDAEGQYFICATSIDADGCIALMCSEMTYDADGISYHDLDFSFYGTPIEPGITDFQGTFEIIYTDRMGTNFHSSLGENACQCLDISEVEQLYSRAIDSEILKVTFQYEGIMESASGESLWIENLDGVFALPVEW